VTTVTIADLFCGAGGTSTGAVQAVEQLGMRAKLTAVNHWDLAVETHSANHPGARHLCASLDALNPRQLFRDGELDLLWASPECTHHSRARGGKPMHDQSRASAWCVTRWAEALSPSVIIVENVPEFAEWGPLGSNRKPLVSRKGDTFRAWEDTLRSLGYQVEHRELCAADYGDPTTRTRLFVQAVRGRRKIVWPEPTHSRQDDLFGSPRWKSAADHVIDWSLPARPISDRKKPLAPRTMERIAEGLKRYGGEPFLVAMEHGGRTIPGHAPMPTVTTAKGGAIGVAFLLGQQSCAAPRHVSEPVPTVSTAGAIALVIEYYQNGKARPVSDPLPTVTCKSRFGLAQASGGVVCFRMLQPHELAAAQGFPRGYKFSGRKAEQVKQIGNAVPCGLSRALVLAQLSQNPRAAVKGVAQ